MPKYCWDLVSQRWYIFKGVCLFSVTAALIVVLAVAVMITIYQWAIWNTLVLIISIETARSPAIHVMLLFIKEKWIIVTGRFKLGDV